MGDPERQHYGSTLGGPQSCHQHPEEVLLTALGSGGGRGGLLEVSCGPSMRMSVPGEEDWRGQTQKQGEKQSREKAGLEGCGSWE